MKYSRYFAYLRNTEIYYNCIIYTLYNYNNNYFDNVKIIKYL